MANTTQFVQGTPEALKTAMDALVTAGKVILFVVTTHQKGKYIIYYTL